MDLLQTVLIVGASVSVNWGGVESPGHLLAKRLGAETVVSARPLAKLHEVMPSEEIVRKSALVVSIDGLYWYWNPDEAIKYVSLLMRQREGKPLILGSIPWPSEESKRVNKFLEDNCSGACILVKLEGNLNPPALHPDQKFMQRVVENVFGR